MSLPLVFPGSFRWGSFALLLTGLLVTGCAVTTQDYSPVEAGPYAVRYEDSFVVNDPVQGRDVRLEVSWPEAVGADSGPYPLVVFSHGAFCYPQQYRAVTDFWVSHGYIVVLPDHLDSPNLGKVNPAAVTNLLQSRVRDMSLVLDSLAAIEAGIPELAGQVDASRAGVAGHSFGGMIAMVKFGMHMQDAEGRLLESYPDPRFRAAVVMSGVGQTPQMANMPQVPYMTADAFAGLTGPLLASGGTLDEGNVGTGVIYPWEWRMGGYTLAPPGDKYSLVLQDADHYLGGLICRENRGGPDDPEAVAAVRAVQTAFLDAYLKDSRAARRWLARADVAEFSSGRGKLERK